MKLSIRSQQDDVVRFLLEGRVSQRELSNSEEPIGDLLGDDAIEFIEQNRTRPFFLFLSHYAVHTPFEAPEDGVIRRPFSHWYSDDKASRIEGQDRSWRFRLKIGTVNLNPGPDSNPSVPVPLAS